MRQTIVLIGALILIEGCSSTASRGKFQDYYAETTTIRFYELELPEERKHEPWKGYGVDSGFPMTVVSALDITALPAPTPFPRTW